MSGAWYGQGGLEAGWRSGCDAGSAQPAEAGALTIHAADTAHCAEQALHGRSLSHAAQFSVPLAASDASPAVTSSSAACGHVTPPPNGTLASAGPAISEKISTRESRRRNAGQLPEVLYVSNYIDHRPPHGISMRRLPARSATLAGIILTARSWHLDVAALVRKDCRSAIDACVHPPGRRLAYKILIFTSS